jgi:hypothetical protein
VQVTPSQRVAVNLSTGEIKTAAPPVPVPVPLPVASATPVALAVPSPVPVAAVPSPIPSPTPVAVAPPVVAPVVPEVVAPKPKPKPIVLEVPVLRHPEAGAHHTVTNGVVLAWQRMTGVQGYRLQVARDTKFAHPLIDERVKINAKGINDAAPGEYFWRLQAYTREMSSAWSPSRSFVLDPDTSGGLLAPVPVKPENGAKVAVGKSTPLIWRRTTVVPGYRVQVARDTSFLDLVLDTKSTANLQVFMPTEPGLYYWRVKSSLESRESAWSPSYSFNVQ